MASRPRTRSLSRVSRHWRRALTAGCALLGAGIAFHAHAQLGDPRREIGVWAEHESLDRFVERLGAALGAPVVRESPLPGTITVHAQGRAGRVQAAQVIGSIANAHGLGLDLDGNGRVMLRFGESFAWRAARELQGQLDVLTLSAALDRLTSLWPADPSESGPTETVVLLGLHGFVVLRPGHSLDPKAIRVGVEALSTPSIAREYARDHPPHALGSGSRTVSKGEGAEIVGLEAHNAELADALSMLASALGWVGVSDPAALGGTLVDYHWDDTISPGKVDAFARALLALQGLELAEGPHGLRYTRPAGSPRLERIPAALAARLSGVRLDASGWSTPSQDLPQLLAMLSAGTGVSLRWEQPCTPEIAFLGERVGRESIVARFDLATLIGAILESHDLLARDAAGGAIELVPRSSCASARQRVPIGAPHPALSRHGLRPGDRIVSIDGTAASEMTTKELRARLRAASASVALGVRRTNGEVTPVEIPAELLLTLLGG